MRGHAYTYLMHGTWHGEDDFVNTDTSSVLCVVMNESSEWNESARSNPVCVVAKGEQGEVTQGEQICVPEYFLWMGKRPQNQSINCALQWQRRSNESKTEKPQIVIRLNIYI